MKIILHDNPWQYLCASVLLNNFFFCIAMNIKHTHMERVHCPETEIKRVCVCACGAVKLVNFVCVCFHKKPSTNNHRPDM